MFPTFGAAFVIEATNKSIINKHIIGNRFMTFIGHISYSLYLWHWPLLVFLKMMYPLGSSSPLCRIPIILIISILCSIFSYYLIENPIRFSKSKIAALPLLIMIILIGITSLIIYNKAYSFEKKFTK